MEGSEKKSEKAGSKSGNPQRWLVGGGSAGAAAAITILLVQREPRLVVDTLQHFGGAWLFGLVAMFMVNSKITEMLEVGRQSAHAQQNLADAVQELSRKDDREKEEQRRLLSYVGSQQEKILNALNELREQGHNKARGAHA